VHLLVGQTAKSFAVQDINGNAIALSDYRARPLLISFFRSASCTLCGLQVWYLAEQYRQWRLQGLQMLAVFESTEAMTRQYINNQHLPFPVIADPERNLFRLYDIETSWRAFLQGIPRYAVSLVQARRKGITRWWPEIHPRLPADFLIAPDQTIHYVNYGKNMADRIPASIVEDYLAHLQQRSAMR
jgi:thioredoxin-dependent peroxiredoxin